MGPSQVSVRTGLPEQAQDRGAPVQEPVDERGLANVGEADHDRAHRPRHEPPVAPLCIDCHAHIQRRLAHLPQTMLLSAVFPEPTVPESTVPGGGSPKAKHKECTRLRLFQHMH